MRIPAPPVLCVALVAVLAVILVGALPACTASTKWPDKRAPIDDQVRATLQSQQQAWNAGDVKGFMAGYDRSPTITFVSGGRIERGFDAMQERFLRSYPAGKQGTLAFSDLEVTPFSSGDGAWVLGRYRLTGAVEQSGIFTLVLKRVGDQFKIVHDHTTADPPPPR